MSRNLNTQKKPYSITTETSSYIGSCNDHYTITPELLKLENESHKVNIIDSTDCLWCGRKLLYEIIPENGVVAEIGVFKGENAQDIIGYNKPSYIHLMDLWDYPNADYHLEKIVKPTFNNLSNVEIHKGDSLELAHKFDNDYFDWVYIDSNKTFKHTIEEIQLYIPKVKSGGYICGHDYIRTDIEHKENVPEHCERCRPISKADQHTSLKSRLDEHREKFNTKFPVDWCVENIPELKFEYLTNEINGCGWNSFALKVIK